MRYIYNQSTDPAYNLAAEEWLLSATSDEIFMLWRNKPAVIVGRNQNTLSEIDETFIRRKDLPVVRRLSGGGAVFHDLGNINFTFIRNTKAADGMDFKMFCEPIMQALGTMGVDCTFSGRNDMLIEGKKFSGNAQHFHKGRILHHGTLLFASDIADLTGALRVKPEKYKDKAVKSVRSRVTNISSHLPTPMDVTEFIEKIMNFVSGDADRGDLLLTESETEQIENMANERYRTWDWNFGYSPAYNFTKDTRTEGGMVEVRLYVKKGRIRKARLFGDYFGVQSIEELENKLIGCRHQREMITEELGDIDLAQYIQGVDLNTFLDCLF